VTVSNDSAAGDSTAGTTGRSTFDVRADGPAVVRKGPAHGPTVVVLDPQGDAKHEGLPATWRPLADDVAVVWWRLPAAVRAGLTGDVLPVELADGRAPLHLVGAGDAAPLAVSLAAQRPESVRSVVLVDPPWAPDDDSPVEDVIDSVAVHRVVTDGTGSPVDLLPLGHPEVLAAVLTALVSSDLWPDDHDGPQVPAAESLASDAWHAARIRLSQLLDTLLGKR
jgi:pimeloyl-ACP methyl ester carboxylesterase